MGLQKAHRVTHKYIFYISVMDLNQTFFPPGYKFERMMLSRLNCLFGHRDGGSVDLWRDMNNLKLQRANVISFIHA